MRGLIPLVQFKKREKHPWTSATFSKVATLLKVTLFHGCLSRFLNCTNGTKSRKASIYLGLVNQSQKDDLFDYNSLEMDIDL